MKTITLIRGGGDIASGVALRLHRAGLRVVVTELANPLVVRRMAAFAQAVYDGNFTLEGVTARLIPNLIQVTTVFEAGEIPILIDPDCKLLDNLMQGLSMGSQLILIDGRMTKRVPDLGIDAADLVIGLGPGFVAGENCHAAIETNRGHFMGRVLWQGSPEINTGIPEGVNGKLRERVLRAPASGVFETKRQICDRLIQGDLIAQVAGLPIHAPFSGVLRGLLYPGLTVSEGLKVGDLDPRDDPQLCSLVSDKSLAVGGGVLEAILAYPAFRDHLWS
jgi:xanthine dehydrogenase accessory factor